MDHAEEKLEPYRSPLQSPDVIMSSTDPMDAAPEQERTTLTGKPIPKTRDMDNHTSMMFADGGGFGGAAGAAGANLLPPGYTDDSLVRIPIRDSDLGPAEPEPEISSSDIYSPEVQMSKKGRFGGLFKGLKEKTTSSRQKQREGGFQIVMMSRGDYLKYWAKDEHGKFLPNVIEPPEGRREWVKMQVEKNEEWIREDPSLANRGANPNHRSKGVSGSMATALADPGGWRIS